MGNSNIYDISDFILFFLQDLELNPRKDTDNMQIEHGQGPEVQFSTNTIFLIIGVHRCELTMWHF